VLAQTSSYFKKCEFDFEFKEELDLQEQMENNSNHPTIRRWGTSDKEDIKVKWFT